MKITGRGSRITGVAATAAAVLATAPIAQARLDDNPTPSATRPSPAEVDARHAALVEPNRPLSTVPGRAAPVRGEPVKISGSHVDWTDAGVGAGVVLGLVLLAGGSALVTRRLSTS